MNIKNNNGVTLITLVITIIVLLILTSITIGNSMSQLGLKNVNNLYVDIDTLSTKVADYYLKNNNLPVFDKMYLSNKTELEQLITSNGADAQKVNINPNDDGAYYVLNLTKLENLTLNYGRDYQSWTTDATSNSSKYQDLYIINSVTHEIYYPHGVKNRTVHYFSKPINNSLITPVELEEVSNGWTVNVNSTSKTTISSDKIALSANITLNLTEDYDINSLEYAWTATNDLNEAKNLEFSKFSVNDSNSVTLTSKVFDDIYEDNYLYLWIRVMDNNGFYQTEIKEISKNS